MIDDKGWIRTLLDEAENERMHLRTFVQLAQPTWFERAVILLAQAVFFVFFFGLYLVSSRTAHRMVGYFEEQAVISYSLYLAEIDAGRVANVAAPAIAIAYWKPRPRCAATRRGAGGARRRGRAPRREPSLRRRVEPGPRRARRLKAVAP